ncbi:hypothetical protein DXT88_19445 [Herbaspirillum lusitanum]|uniref:TIR domain-containing protein n=1 Tax=Herbaspirillum lusitanum TaxID=213312 RepID=UPI0022376748|nr:TIR domain-containing protein [Herbaspirillum lusitanum]MCW5300351.1 hypothetical protein [Herbaspirillum lusitanum]
MGRKIFISYKYGDERVESLRYVGTTTARHYVDKLQEILDEEDHINKGEQDGTDLSAFKDSTIESSLREKIYDSSLTIVLVSRGMKSIFDSEADQWMPWEISYSLREKTRDGRTAKPNGILVVTLPDEHGDYDFFIEDESCKACKCRSLDTNFLFKILALNMFNVKAPNYVDCNNHAGGSKVYSGNSSYIHSVKWSDFTADPNKYIDLALAIRDDIDSYSITKQIP